MTPRNAAIVVLLCSSACTPLRPRVSLAPGASLKGYRVFLVPPVTDRTGAHFNLDVSDSLQQQLARRLRSHGLTVVTDSAGDTTAAALVIITSLVDFRGIPMWLQVPARGVTGCELRSVLRDHQTGQQIGEIVASELGEGRTPLIVLVECAHDMADAIARQVRR